MSRWRARRDAQKTRQSRTARASLLRYLHSYKNRHVLRGIEFSRGSSQVPNRIIANYYVRSFIPDHVKEARARALSLARAKKTREVDRCCCQANLREECEIRVLLRETRGRFIRTRTIFRRGTIFAFAYISDICAYTLRRRISCAAYYLYLYFMLGENFERNGVSASAQ